MTSDTLILTASNREQLVLRARVKRALRVSLGHRSLILGRIGVHEVALLETGIGAVNTAQALTAALETGRPDVVLQAGVGGAYVRSGLQVGDLSVASEEVYGDFGVRTPEGWQGADALGIPVLKGDPDRYNRFPVDPGRAALAESTLRDAALSPTVALGRFLTVQTCSGVEAEANALADRFIAICENMEGAAAAHVCALYGVPFVEIRGISNRVVDRDRSAWDIPLAAERAQQAALAALDAIL